MPDFVSDIAAAVEALGADKAGIILGIGFTQWPDEETRDEFLKKVTRRG